MSFHPWSAPGAVGAGLLVAALACAPARAQVLEGTPKQLEGVGIDEKLDAPLPLELTFRDEDGKTVTLGKYFGQGKPVALNLVYFNCPMLCNIFLDGFTAGVRDLGWTPGKEFEVVTVSIDPTDTPERATAKRAHYIESLGKPEAAAGWHFLTGTQEAVSRLADAVGFRYRYDEKKHQYMHSTALFVATPEGRISRVLYGVAFDPQTLRLSLVEASDGKVGSPVDKVLLFCFAYDSTQGRYGPTAYKLMRAGGALTMLVVAIFLVIHWRRDSRRRRRQALGADA